jgi:DNA helicase IV
VLYRRLDEVRERAAVRLAGVLDSGRGDRNDQQSRGTHQAASERDAGAAVYAEQLARYAAVENELCFGRLDLVEGDRRYVGRIGLFADTEDREPLLIDWRAPSARPFYVATPISPEGVVRRRQIHTRGRRVLSVDDEAFDLDLLDGAETGLVGEAALLAALNAPRSGRMRDIVRTIQVEQDRVIRSDLAGVMVVQGGPGTGKTAVALHRAAYLLYTYREQLVRRGVMVLGPSAVFLRYIAHVLPSLAETGVLLRSVAELFPGVWARGTEDDRAAEIKGRPEMAEAVAAAVRDRQELPGEQIEITVDGHRLLVDRATCARARDRARATGLLHNLARPVFAREVVDALARQLADQIGTDPFADDPLGGDDAPGDPQLLSDQEVAELAGELAAEPVVRRVVNRLWPRLTPERLLADLYASPDRLAAALPGLAEDQRALLVRDVRAEGWTAAAGQDGDGWDGWTPADVPLLDEAAELLGLDDRSARLAAEQARRRRIAYAQGVLDIAAGSQSFEAESDGGFLLPTDLLDAELLAERHADAVGGTTAERAAADRTWTFGHVVVDEAQDLSPMVWRVLMRRCPARSMTLVGDLAQASVPGGTSSWAEVLEPYLGDRWRLAELTVNYRTPSEIMEVAAGLLAEIDPGLVSPGSVRSGGNEPWAHRVDAAALPDALVAVVRGELDRADGGTLGVIVPEGMVGTLGEHLAAAVPGTAVGVDPDLADPVVLLGARAAKGLEFDTVVVVEPGRILTGSSRGSSELYVALTRATRRLGVLHSEDLPACLGWGRGPGRGTTGRVDLGGAVVQEPVGGLVGVPGWARRGQRAEGQGVEPGPGR